MKANETKNKYTKLIMKIIALLIISGTSAWACGEMWGDNYPLSFFFSMLSVASMVIAIVGIIITAEN
jgi:hypothetical protein